MSSSEEDDDRPIAYDRLAPLGGLGLPVLGLGLPATAAAPRERCVRPFPLGAVSYTHLTLPTILRV